MPAPVVEVTNVKSSGLVKDAGAGLVAWYRIEQVQAPYDARKLVKLFSGLLPLLAISVPGEQRLKQYQGLDLFNVGDQTKARIDWSGGIEQRVDVRGTAYGCLHKLHQPAHLQNI